MIDYFNFVSFLPALFLLPVLPGLSRFFLNVDKEKFAYGAATSGILLTFFGIWQGLVVFDVGDIGSSIPAFITGLKLAFGSSVVGLATSMLINIFFVKSKDDVEESLEKMVDSLIKLEAALSTFAQTTTEMQTNALIEALERLIKDLELGINSETKEVMSRFRTSVEFLREWQERYVDEIQSVTQAMDQNAVVTKVSTEQLDRTNQVLAELKPVTETIAESINWVQTALPAMRKRANLTITQPEEEDEK